MPITAGTAPASAEDDVEDPAQAVLDGPVSADGVGGVSGGEPVDLAEHIRRPAFASDRCSAFSINAIRNDTHLLDRPDWM